MCADDFLYRSSKAQAPIPTITMWHLMKGKSFCRATDTIFLAKQQPTECEKRIPIIEGEYT